MKPKDGEKMINVQKEGNAVSDRLLSWLDIDFDLEVFWKMDDTDYLFRWSQINGFVGWQYHVSIGFD